MNDPKLNSLDKLQDLLTTELELDRLDELLSLMFDECLTSDQVVELNDLLLANPEARQRALEAAQLHADLYLHFRPESPANQGPGIAPALPLPIPGFGPGVTG